MLIYDVHHVSMSTPWDGSRSSGPSPSLISGFERPPFGSPFAFIRVSRFALRSITDGLARDPTREDGLRRVSVMVVGLPPGDFPAELDEPGVDLEVRRFDDFATAKNALAAMAPDVLVTAVRLGAYNGLHLVLRAATASPTIAAIVVSETEDVVLQREAEALGATFVRAPLTVDHLRSAVRNRSIH